MTASRSGEAAEAGPWNVRVSVGEVPEQGRHVELTADEATRTAIAAAANLVALPRLDVRFELTRYGQAGVRVVGQVSANVVQSCVVTLEPLESLIDEAVDVTFAPPRGAPKAAKKTDPDDEDAAVAIDAFAPDPPEVLHGDAVDLGAIAIEFLLLGLEPYPRKPGATFEPTVVGDAGPNPFAALAALKKES